MTKYHIKKDGTVGICKAQEGNCPLGKIGTHFYNKEDALKYIYLKNEKRIYYKLEF